MTKEEDELAYQQWFKKWRREVLKEIENKRRAEEEDTFYEDFRKATIIPEEK